MKIRRPACAILAVYDVLRLSALLAVACLLRVELIATNSLVIASWPLAVLTSQALFPLMSGFLALDFRRFAPYATLYAAGKILSVVASCAYCLGTVTDLVANAGQYVPINGVLLASLAIAMVLDLISALVALRLSAERDEAAETQGGA